VANDTADHTTAVAEGTRTFDGELVRHFSQSLDLFCVAGFDGYLKLVNPAFQRTLGISEDELMTRPFVDFCHPDDVEDVRWAVEELQSGNDVVGFVSRLVCADGSSRWIEWNTSSYPEQGVLYGVGRDVTDRVRADAELGIVRRVATLVREGIPGHDLLAAVVEEVGRTVDVPLVSVVRYDGDGTATVCASWSPDGPPFPAGARWTLDGDSALRAVRESGRPARIDSYAGSRGQIARIAEERGICSSAAIPIEVDGVLWGAMVISSMQRLAADVESRLSDVTELLASAIANANAREALNRGADEQDALRRLALLVAQGAPPDEVFATVSDEVGRLFGTDAAWVVKFETFGPPLLMVGAGKGAGRFMVGTRWEHDDLYPSTRVFRTGRSARVDRTEVEASGGLMAEVLRQERLAGTVACPIVVDGHLWGTITATTHEATLPIDTEVRLEKFTELVATAISNAHATSQLARIAEEQAALRRVATLVANDVPPADIFIAVAEEVGQVFGTGLSTALRFEHDPPSAVMMGATKVVLDSFPVGTRVELTGPISSAEVYRTGRPARVDGQTWSALTGPVAETGRSLHVTSTVACPINVESRLWGTMMVSASEGELLPPDTEERLQRFTDLVAMAIANAESREARAQLVDEQAALRRVATQVARGVPPVEIFETVSDEVGRVLCTDAVWVVKFEDDGQAMLLVSAGKGTGRFTAGTKFAHDDLYPSTRVFRTGRSVRIGREDFEAASGPIADALRHERLAGFASPITVDGHLWGTIAVMREEAHPIDTEARLERFTGLVATAISNAQARSELARIAEEQAALRRLATLVAEEAPPAKLFAKVTEEAAAVFGVADCTMLRDELDGTGTVVGLWSRRAAEFLGVRLPIDGDSATMVAIRESRPARVDDYSALTSKLGPRGVELGMRSGVACPVVVRGRVWGAIGLASYSDVVAADAEARLAQFADLVATAIANAQARAEVKRLADEQAALRRMATRVAEGVPASEIFAAVCNEVGALFGADTAAIVRFETDQPSIRVVGVGRGLPGIEVGTLWELDDALASTQVYRTGRAARIENRDFSVASGPIHEPGRQLGLGCTVAVPILVEGRVWGTISISSTDSASAHAESNLERFAELVATAIANADGRAQLAASRRRIVTASDETRRQIERDLHDGMQQRLISLALALRAAQRIVPPGNADLEAELSAVAGGLTSAVDELREISSGIHPAIISQGGLPAALGTLARRSSLPVALDVVPDVHAGDQIEVAAYFVASEALANAAKHAQASTVALSLQRTDGGLLLCVRDDGIGGASATHGSGLTGLADRVEALGGSLRIESRRGEGTAISVRLPIDPEVDDPAIVGGP
jgi:PAS domain S-box-containing protein